MKSRVLLLVAGFAFWVVAIGARLYDLQVHRHDEFVRRAERQQQRVIELDPPRGTLYDARGRELAVSVEVESAFAVPREIADPEAAATALARALKTDRARLARQLGRDREFVWIARKLDPPEARAVRDLGLAGVYFLEESKRYYPLRETAAQVLGYVGTDNQGLGGLEARYDSVVAGRAGRRTVLRDAKAGMALPPDLPSAAPVPGQDLALTLDAAIQAVAERELAATVERLRAKNGSVVLLDPESGAILALASYPTFDPNRFSDSGPESWRNRPIADAYEPGSTFKMVTAAAALELGLIRPEERIDCEMGGITLAGVRIADHKPFGLLTFREIIAKSSNVGTIKTALRVSNRDFYDTVRAFGFGRTTGVDLPGESPGLLMPVERWPALAKAYISFGQGISITPLQLAVAFAAVANGGRLLEPYVVERIGSGPEAVRPHPAPVERRRPVSAATIATLRSLLEGVTVEGGPAGRPRSPATGSREDRYGAEGRAGSRLSGERAHRELRRLRAALRGRGSSVRW
ncbi:MAG: penicillin-binding protein 2 [Holophagales bacterium]|nr:penicillin-binding protein 2 [Holophagales bacterium]